MSGEAGDPHFSVELWLKRTKNASLQAVAGKPLTTTTKSENYAIWIDTSNDARFDVGAGSKSATVTCTTHPLDTGWHHIVGTFASGTLKIYYDGSLCNTATATFTTAGTNSNTFDLGRAGTSNYFGGSLDELGVYSTALTATQVTDHYNKGINNRLRPDTATTTTATKPPPEAQLWATTWRTNSKHSRVAARPPPTATTATATASKPQRARWRRRRPITSGTTTRGV
jgi:Concanavalin A-like lectin/glucanases superfamily